MAARHAYEEELAALQAGDERAADLERQAAAAAKVFLAEASTLTASRRAAGKRLVVALEATLGQLAMPQARVEVRVETAPDQVQAWTAQGVDTVEFFLSPNPGEELRPLARIASGGELSRIMLALKTLATPDTPGRTLIFDEVDAGISGAAADAVGARLQALGGKYQVLCVTHLAQIAARGSSHLHITKEVRDGRTLTLVSRLDGLLREEELARMITGPEVTPQFLASAREMLVARQVSEQQAKGESESRPRAKAKAGRRGA
jgi:DNA repair protein RecN (Recombination protein N)